MSKYENMSARSLRRKPPSSAPRANYVSQWYYPEPTFMPMLTVKALKKIGLSTRVLTGIPNLPDGEVYGGYNAWRPSSEMIDGVRVRRAPLFPSHSKSALLRMVNYLSWSFCASIFGHKQLRTADINIVHGSPATAAIPAFLTKILYGVPYIVIVYDLWPETVTASGLVQASPFSRFLSAVLLKVVNVLYRNADKVLVTSPGQERLLADRGIDPKLISLLYNSIDEGTYRPFPRDTRVRRDYAIDEGDFLIVYAGNHGVAQDLGPVIEAVSKIPEEYRVKLLLIGWGVEKERLAKIAELVAPSSVIFRDRVRPEELRHLQAGADLNLVSLKADPLFSVTMPSKLQSLLASGLPILGILDGDPAKALLEAGAGLTARPGDVGGIRRAIVRATQTPLHERESWGESGAAYYSATMSADNRMKRLAAVIAEVLDDGALR